MSSARTSVIERESEINLKSQKLSNKKIGKGKGAVVTGIAEAGGSLNHQNNVAQKISDQ